MPDSTWPVFLCGQRRGLPSWLCVSAVKCARGHVPLSCPSLGTRSVASPFCLCMTAVKCVESADTNIVAHVYTCTSVFKQRCACNLVFASVVCCRNLKPFSAPGASGGDGGQAYHFSGTKETLLALSSLWTALTRCWYKILQPSTEFSLHDLPELPADISPLYISASGSSQGHSPNHNNPLRCLTFSTVWSSNKQCIFK